MKTLRARRFHPQERRPMQTPDINALPPSLGDKPTRNDRLLFGCDVKGVGLEIGASYSPVAPKNNGHNVEVLDHADQNTLRRKYAGLGVDVEKIEPVDYVWQGEPLHELTGKRDHYDWIIASHVIEHSTDLVSFLQECQEMLKPEGVLCLAVPDHRFCFDVFRPASTPGEVIQAFVEKRKRHTAGAVWDYYSMIACKGGEIAWSSKHPGDYSLYHPQLAEAVKNFHLAQQPAEYVDIHNWRFTPASFQLIHADLVFHDFIRMGIRHFFDTVGCEFIVQLQKKSAPVVSTAESSRCAMLQEMMREDADRAPERKPGWTVFSSMRSRFRGIFGPHPGPDRPAVRGSEAETGSGGQQADEQAPVLQEFIDRLAALDAPSVLELALPGGVASRNWAPHSGEHVMAFVPPPDATAPDVYALSSALGQNRFDAVFSFSALQRIRFPWIAVLELARVLKPGGLAFVQTHLAFPLQTPPQDYWRFSADALRALFCGQAGFQVIGTEHVFKARIVSSRVPAVSAQTTHLNVHILAEKAAHPAPDFVWRPDSTSSSQAGADALADPQE